MIITSPQNSEYTENTIFLAGGISNCWDWQKPVAEFLSEYTNLVIFNPRRNGWNMENSDEESRKQILWEHKFLQQSKTILFWFPEETLCPITLFELGKYLVSDKRLIVGTHPNYQRRLDVIVQSQLVRPDIKIYDDVDMMTSAFVSDYRLGFYP